ncbi:MAG: hypothetical protein HY689_04370 [Chloroflexi bacterium]|nr:hypothetical protein [Chloroflexota bacterium]
MWDIPSWLPVMNSLRPLLTDTGTVLLYAVLVFAVLCQVGVFVFGAYKVLEMLRQAE